MSTAGWGNNAGGGWEATVDPTWGTAPPAAGPTGQPSFKPIDASVDIGTNGEYTTTTGDAPHEAASGSAPAVERGANDEWTGHGQAKYNYDEFSARGDLGDFDSNARVYHWDGEEGDVGPEFPELEHELFGPPDQRLAVIPADFAK